MQVKEDPQMLYKQFEQARPGVTAVMASGRKHAKPARARVRTPLRVHDARRHFPAKK